MLMVEPTNGVSLSFSVHTGDELIDTAFVGEWTGAMTDCAKYLNGLGRGARYDGTYLGSPYVGDCSWVNDISKWSETNKDDTRKYIETQIAAFEGKTQGWFFWNFKTENAAEWDALALVDAGVFPAIRNGEVEYKFPKVCTNF
jgi:glucan 1,3-beta-glucosidase